MNNINNLYDLGWNESLDKEFKAYENNFTVGRVCSEFKNIYKLITLEGEKLASVTGKMMYTAQGRADYPAVGDWVLIDKADSKGERAVIHKILPRKSKFSRKTAGAVIEEQIVAANVDFLFICMSLNQDFNVRRIERYTTMAWESGAVPIVILTKADLCEDASEKVRALEAVTMGIDIKIVSALKDSGIDLIKSYLAAGKTGAFLGSSGVGKSTLINKLLGYEALETMSVREDDDKGRHTTTHRELFVLPYGGIVIDTPGMREFQILDAEQGIDTTFEDIQILASQCKFSDCSHGSEPGCAVKKAIGEGSLSEVRFNNYIKLKKEADYIARKTDRAAATAYTNQIKSIHKQMRKRSKS